MHKLEMIADRNPAVLLNWHNALQLSPVQEVEIDFLTIENWGSRH